MFFIPSIVKYWFSASKSNISNISNQTWDPDSYHFKNYNPEFSHWLFWSEQSSLLVEWSRAKGEYETILDCWWLYSFWLSLVFTQHKLECPKSLKMFKLDLTWSFRSGWTWTWPDLNLLKQNLTWLELEVSNQVFFK